MYGSQIDHILTTDDLLCWHSADMHYSCKVSGGSQVGPSLSSKYTLQNRLSKTLGLAPGGDSVNAILDHCMILSETAVTGPDKWIQRHIHARYAGIEYRDL